MTACQTTDALCPDAVRCFLCSHAARWWWVFPLCDAHKAEEYDPLPGAKGPPRQPPRLGKPRAGGLGR